MPSTPIRKFGGRIAQGFAGSVIDALGFDGLDGPQHRLPVFGPKAYSGNAR